MFQLPFTEDTQSMNSICLTSWKPTSCGLSVLGLICVGIVYLPAYLKHMSVFVGTKFMSSTQETQFRCTFVTES